MTKITRRVAAGFGAAAFVIAVATAISYAARPAAGPGTVRVVQAASDPAGVVPDTSSTTSTTAAPDTTAVPVTTVTTVAPTTTTTRPATTTTTAAPVETTTVAPVETTTTTVPAPPTTTTTGPCPASNAGATRDENSWGNTHQFQVDVSNTGAVTIVVDDAQMTRTTYTPTPDGQMTPADSVLDGGHGVPINPGQTVKIDVGQPVSGSGTEVVTKVVYHVDGRPDCTVTFGAAA
jgi:hypothetical protein